MTTVTTLDRNPDPKNLNETPYYTIDESGQCLWDIAMNIAEAEAAQKGQTLTGNNLNIATENELGIIERANPQLLDKPQGYDLVYIGDKIALPPQTPGTSFGAVSNNEPKTAFTPPTREPSGEPGTPYTSVMQPGQDILSTNGQYDLVLGYDGQLVLYKLQTPYERPKNYAPGQSDSPTVVWQSDPNKLVASAVPTAYGVEMFSADGTQVGTLTSNTLSSKMPGTGLAIIDNSVG